MIDIHRVTAAKVPDVSAKRADHPRSLLPASVAQMAQQLAAMETRLTPVIAPRDFVPPVKPDQTNALIAASLAGGMIAASGKAHTAAEAVGVWREVREGLSTEH